MKQHRLTSASSSVATLLVYLTMCIVRRQWCSMSGDDDAGGRVEQCMGSMSHGDRWRGNEAVVGIGPETSPPEPSEQLRDPLKGSLAQPSGKNKQQHYVSGVNQSISLDVRGPEKTVKPAPHAPGCRVRRGIHHHIRGGYLVIVIFFNFFIFAYVHAWPETP